MNKTGAEAPGKLPGCRALILWCCAAVTHPHPVLNCRSSPGNTSVRGSGHTPLCCRRLSEADRQGELLSIKLLFYWLPNWPWNHCAELGGFSSRDEGEDLLVSSKSRGTKHAFKNKQDLLIFISVDTKLKVKTRSPGSVSALNPTIRSGVWMICV